MAFKLDYTSLNSGIGLESDLSNQSLGGIIGIFLPYILVGAGLILFIMLLAGGFNMLTGAANAEAQEKGKKQITSALIGFLIVFLSYWIAQALQIIFKISIVS